MVFEVSTAKKEVLEKLAEGDWTPTELAEELDKSRSSVYNHLDELYERGVLTKTKVEAKTRPKTRYSIGNGFIQYITVLPGQFNERVLGIDRHKEAIIRIWNVPQEEFHPYIEEFWRAIEDNADVDLEENVVAVAVYGSVARGEANAGSDIDLLLIAEGEEAEQTLNETFGSIRLTTEEGSKIGIVEVYTKEDYRSSLAHGSSFLENVQDEFHVLYDPEKLLVRPEEA